MSKNLHKKKYLKTVWINNIINQVNYQSIALRNAIITTDPVRKAEELEIPVKSTKQVQENKQQIEENIEIDAEKQLFEKMSEARDGYISIRQ